MYENLTSNINFYNYIIAKQKFLNTQTNFFPLNLVRHFQSSNSSEIKDYNNIEQSNNITTNIKVNKLNFDDLNRNKEILSKTNRNFYYNKLINKRNKRFNFTSEHINTINNDNNNNSINDLLYSYKDKRRRTSLPLFENISNENLYNNSMNTQINNLFNRNENLFETCDNEKIKVVKYSKISYNFKNIKMFYAHLELLISLYLKRNFKHFIKQIKQNEKFKSIVNMNLYNTINNQNHPIINLNNAHCSLFCSININKDNNEIYNNQIIPSKSIENNSNQNSKILIIKKNILNNIHKQNYPFNIKKEINIIKKNDRNNKNIYIPKNRRKSTKEFANKEKNKYKTIKNSSPIKEMNIDLKKMNLNENKNKNKQDTQNSLKDQKNKLKSSISKRNIYKRPKEYNNTSKNLIKEIKIKNKDIIFTPNENKNKNINLFENIISRNPTINNSIKKIYIRKNNSIGNDIIKTKLFNNKSDFNSIKTYSYGWNNKHKEILIKKIVTNDKRIFININYIALNVFTHENDRSKINYFPLLKIENNISIIIIKNTLLMLDLFNQNLLFSDIFIFDNDQKNNKDKKMQKSNNILFSYNNKKNKIVDKNIKKQIQILNFIKTIEYIIIKTIRKYALNIYKRYIYLKRIIIKEKNKILIKYFKRFFAHKNKNVIKSKIYHKINYNDDFNINKKLENKTNIKKNNNIKKKTHSNNLNSKNNNTLNRNKNKKNKNPTQISSNFSSIYKYWNKEINITVHENKNTNNKKKNINSYNKK